MDRGQRCRVMPDVRARACLTKKSPVECWQLLPSSTTSFMAPLADFLFATLPLRSLGVPYEWTHYVPGKTPMSTPHEVFPALVAYLVIIFGVQAWMKNRPPLKLQFLFRIHNAFLTSGSLLLVTLMMEEVLPLVYKNGVFWGMCNVKMWSEVSDTLPLSCPTRIYVSYRDSSSTT